MLQNLKVQNFQERTKHIEYYVPKAEMKLTYFTAKIAISDTLNWSDIYCSFSLYSHLMEKGYSSFPLLEVEKRVGHFPLIYRI